MARMWTARLVAIPLLAIAAQGCMVKANDYKALQEQFADQEAIAQGYHNALIESKAELREWQEKYAKLEAQESKEVVQADSTAPAELQKIWEKLEQLAQANRQTMTWDAANRKLMVSVEFDTGSVNIKAASKTALSKVAGALRDLNPEFVAYVDGHTDNDPVVQPTTISKFTDNPGLAAARALSVYRHLREERVPPHQMITRSFGQYYPVADNTTADGKQRNRRVEISVVPAAAAFTPAAAYAVNTASTR